MADDARHRSRVTIGGTDYTLRGEASETHLRGVARAVDSLMQQIASANPRLDGRRIAVLTAVNLEDELIRLREENRQLREENRELQSKYHEVLVLLDEHTRVSPESSPRSGGV